MATKKNQLIIDLGKVRLTNEQRKILQAGIHKVVASKMKKIQSAANKKEKDIMPPKAVAKKEVTGLMANIEVTFTNTNPGLSTLTATLRGKQKKLDQSGTINFANVRTADIILIQVDCLGSTTATIDISADPMQLNFPPGPHSGSFFIN
jgi:hypothetical protein